MNSVRMQPSRKAFVLDALIAACLTWKNNWIQKEKNWNIQNYTVYSLQEAKIIPSFVKCIQTMQKTEFIGIFSIERHHPQKFLCPSSIPSSAVCPR